MATKAYSAHAPHVIGFLKIICLQDVNLLSVVVVLRVKKMVTSEPNIPPEKEPSVPMSYNWETLTFELSFEGELEGGTDQEVEQVQLSGLDEDTEAA